MLPDIEKYTNTTISFPIQWHYFNKGRHCPAFIKAAMMIQLLQERQLRCHHDHLRSVLMTHSANKNHSGPESLQKAHLWFLDLISKVPAILRVHNSSRSLRSLLPSLIFCGSKRDERNGLELLTFGIPTTTSSFPSARGQGFNFSPWNFRLFRIQSLIDRPTSVITSQD